MLLTDISNLGKTAGIEIKSFKREDERIHDFYAEVPIAVAFEGRYHDIARFFDLVAKLPRIVNMGSIQMSVVEPDRAGDASQGHRHGDGVPLRGTTGRGRRWPRGGQP